MFDDITYAIVVISLLLNLFSIRFIKHTIYRKLIKKITIVSLVLGFILFFFLIIMQGGFPNAIYIFYVSLGLWNFGFYESLILLMFRNKKKP